MTERFSDFANWNIIEAATAAAKVIEAMIMITKYDLFLADCTYNDRILAFCAGALIYGCVGA